MNSQTVTMSDVAGESAETDVTPTQSTFIRFSQLFLGDNTLVMQLGGSGIFFVTQ